MTLQEKKSTMFDLVEQWQGSGISQIEFSQLHDLTIQKMRYWICRYRRETQSDSAFIRLNGFSHQGISIRYPNGVELVLSAQIPVSALKSLIKI